jgi:hypothetical protein
MKKSTKIKIGIIVILISFVPFLLIPVVPFLNLENSVKIAVSTGLLIAGEILFWSGGLLLGKELFAKYKSLLNPKNWKKE